MTYQDIVPEINKFCQKYPDCFFAKPATDCPYIDLCLQNHEGPRNGYAAFETAILTRYIELREKKPQKKFYFTFGSDPGFPFQNTFVIVIADTEENAVKKFRAKFPDRRKDIVNCAFWYTEEDWRESQNQTDYDEPAEVIA